MYSTEEKTKIIIVFERTFLSFDEIKILCIWTMKTDFRLVFAGN